MARIVTESQETRHHIRLGFEAYARSQQPMMRADDALLRPVLEEASAHFHVALTQISNPVTRGKIRRLVAGVDRMIGSLSETEGIPIVVGKEARRKAELSPHTPLDTDGMSIAPLRVMKTRDSEGFVSPEDLERTEIELPPA